MLAVTPGDCATAQLRAAGVATEVLPWRDLLHEGPVPAGLDAGALAQVRAGYIRSVGWPGGERAEAELMRARRGAGRGGGEAGRDRPVVRPQPVI